MLGIFGTAIEFPNTTNKIDPYEKIYTLNHNCSF